MPGRLVNSRHRGGLRRLPAVVALVSSVLLGACQVRTELNIDVDGSGGGTVEMAVGLDDDALARVGDLGDLVRVDALQAAGWTLEGPERDDEGVTWTRLRHPFGRPEELGILVDEIVGSDGPFRDFSLVRRDSFVTSEYVLNGVVDFAGARSTSAPELTEGLEALREQSVAAVDEIVVVQVAARLPGSVESNASTRAGNGAVWRPSVLSDQAIELVAVGQEQRTARIVWVAVAVTAVIAAAFVVLVRVAMWRRRARSGSSGNG